MKIEAEIKFLNTVSAVFPKMDNNSFQLVKSGETKKILVDLDYVSDLDDVIQRVEEVLFENLKVALHYKVDFFITNEVEICSSL